MLEGIYRAAGLRVGLFTSPHLVSFRERIQINRRLISEGDVALLAGELKESLGEFPPTQHPTMFEVVTVMALKFFAEQKCDLVVWESGLGGRLDATNIVMPLASVITNIAFDHQQWLGDTLEKIAAEKAGIIKFEIPVVTATEEKSALAVIEKTAQEKKSPLTKVNAASSLQYPGSLLGAHQQVNAALALATVEILKKQIPLSTEKIREGLSNVIWPGRLQLIEKSNGQKMLLDGAHNIAGVETLRSALLSWSSSVNLAGHTLKRELHEGALTCIVGFLADKDWRPMCEILAPLASKIFTVPVASARTADANELANNFRSANPRAEVMGCKNLSEALNASKDDAFVVITGSLYLIGEALELLGHSPAGAGERGLNEWSSEREKN
jgi:dihydrofolate synthase/folylpolyglutamate synthase